MYQFKVALKAILILFLLCSKFSVKGNSRTRKTKKRTSLVRVTIGTKKVIFQTNEQSPSVAIDSSVLDYNLLPLFK